MLQCVLGDGAQPPMRGNTTLAIAASLQSPEEANRPTKSCRAAFRHPFNTWCLQELRTSSNTQDFLSATFMHDELVPRTQLWFSYLSPLFLLHFFPHPLSGTPGNNKELFVWFLLLPLIFWCIWCCESRAVRDPLSSVCSRREEFSLVWGR